MVCLIIPRNLVFILLLLLISLHSLLAADLDKVVEAFNRMDYATALKEWSQLAEQGDAEYQYRLGVLYNFGMGVAKDGTQAVYWYRKAAEQGITDAQVLLGMMYQDGDGVAENDTQAVYWYKKAAEQGHAKAQNYLGGMYVSGEGTAEDYILAYMWANLAGAKGEDVDILKRYLKDRMTRAQIAEAQRLSREWRPNQTKVNPGKATITTGKGKNPPDYTGSSFVISQSGHLLSNRHVVDGCTELRAGGYKIKIIAEDSNNDLALLKLDQSVNTIASFREGRGARIGDKVVAAGFPLRGLLGSGLNVTFGNVSSLSGTGNDSRMLQISAPVNPGNSGGPLIDDSGHIVGIVTSKLNALLTAKATGDIPQGANFAIKSSIIRIFLDLNNVNYETARSRSPRSSTVIADEAAKYTLLIECWK